MHPAHPTPQPPVHGEPEAPFIPGIPAEVIAPKPPAPNEAEPEQISAFLGEIRKRGPLPTLPPDDPAERGSLHRLQYAAAHDCEGYPELAAALRLGEVVNRIVGALIDIEATLPPISTWPDLLRLAAKHVDLAHCPMIHRALGYDAHGSSGADNPVCPPFPLSDDALFLHRFLSAADCDLDAVAYHLGWEYERKRDALSELLLAVPVPDPEDHVSELARTSHPDA